jgi:hypothetical protein
LLRENIKKAKLNTNADALSRISGIVLENEGQSQLEINDEVKRQILYEYHGALSGEASGNKQNVQ